MNTDADRRRRYEDFEEFFDREYRTLVRSLVPAAQGLDAAEEAAQEAMRRVFERWRRVGRMASPVGYAYVVGANSLKRRFRGPRAAVAEYEIDEDHLDNPGPVDDPAHLVADRDELVTALGRISAIERDALLLVSFLGLRSDEAAEALRVKPASVRSRLHRARQSLRAAIEEGRKDDF